MCGLGGLWHEGAWPSLHLPRPLWPLSRPAVRRHVHPPDATTSRRYDTVEGLYDVSWSEVHADVLVTAVADGGVMLFNAKIPGRAVSGWREHRRETSCVEWNLVSRDETFLSTSYDGTIKIWQANHPSGSVATLQGHAGYVYQASWSPREATAILSVGADRSICLWDTRSSSSPVQRVVGAHENEILSVDWNKWDSLQFATGSVDATVRIWDWRLIRASSATTSPSSQLLRGHHRAIRRVKWSPYSATSLASGGYDMALRVWDLRSLNPMVGVWEGHTEFVTGVDFSLHDRSILLATTAWDQTIQLLRPKHWGQW